MGQWQAAELGVEGNWFRQQPEDAIIGECAGEGASRDC